MGLFDNVFGNKPPEEPLGAAEAFAGILVAACACDRDVAEEEVAGLVTIARRMKLFNHMPESGWNSTMKALCKILRKEGGDTLLDKCAAALPEELRDCAFANACDIILADGDVEPEEKQFLDKLQNKLAIDSDTALTVVEVMIIKNKG